MKLAVVDVNNTQHWAEVHKDGCADLNKRYRGSLKGRGAWIIETDNRTDATWAIASDHITDEEHNTLADYLHGHIHWAPCLDELPDEAPKPKSAAESDYDQVVADIQANWDQYRAGQVNTKTYLRRANTLHAQLAEAMYLVEGTD